MQAMNPRLIATVGPLKGTSIQIPEDGLTFGRLEGNDVNVEDDLVSRRHAGFRLQDGRGVGRDLGSKNGTFVNGEPISKRVLKHGDEADEPPAFVDDDNDRLRNVTTLKVVRDEPLFPNTDPLRARFLQLISR